MNILVIEDDKYFRAQIIQNIGQGQNRHTVYEASNITFAENIINTKRIDLAFVDLNLSDNKEQFEGIHLIQLLKENMIPAIALTSHNSEQVIKECFLAGAKAYFVKDNFIDNFQSLTREFLSSTEELNLDSFFKSKFVTGNKDLINNITNFIKVAKNSESRVLITGPTGVGKTEVAKLIAQTSDNTKIPFVHINLNELSENLIESELFGHKKGSFTGATEDKVGLFAKANNGILFIDEIGSISLKIQKKLLTVLETKQFSKVGSTDIESSNFRLISATCDNLEELILRNEFRLDLYYRLKGLHLDIPSLNKRPEDIQLLIEHFLSQSTKKLFLDDQAKELLNDYSWPGNVRELKSLVDELINCSTGMVTKSDLPTWISDRYCSSDLFSNHNELYDYATTHGLNHLVEKIQKTILKRTIEEEGNKVNSVVKKLGISKSVFYRLTSEDRA
tara:strand:+ start:135949 stop:137292 length:1344 start_codon:yes stop_codon:yes gene_type:complete